MALDIENGGFASLIDPSGCGGRVKLEDEADDFRVSMAELGRLSEGDVRIDLSVVEPDRTPWWAIGVGVRIYLPYISLGIIYKFSI
ncbi:hypothetical protein [Halorubrum halophilum]|uniref:hypothetical protein n=1 Tax=Halorubrum halophilum TaxID=413816 RepID=UPI0006786A69|nr:hypothetical protein [Halorubrum halophilum]